MWLDQTKKQWRFGASLMLNVEYFWCWMDFHVINCRSTFGIQNEQFWGYWECIPPQIRWFHEGKGCSNILINFTSRVTVLFLITHQIRHEGITAGSTLKIVHKSHLGDTIYLNFVKFLRVFLFNSLVVTTLLDYIKTAFLALWFTLNPSSTPQQRRLQRQPE